MVREGIQFTRTDECGVVCLRMGYLFNTRHMTTTGFRGYHTIWLFPLFA